MTASRIPPTTKHPPSEKAVDDLTIEYPYTDGEPMAEDDAQLTAMIDAITPLREWFDSREDVYVGGDMLMYYRMNDNETRVAPDVFVVMGVSSRHRRRSWIVWREGRPPDFVMELALESTWRRDMREKRNIYAEMAVTEYWRFDPSGSYFVHHSLASGWKVESTPRCRWKPAAMAYCEGTVPFSAWICASCPTAICACTTRQAGGGS